MLGCGTVHFARVLEPLLYDNLAVYVAGWIDWIRGNLKNGIVGHGVLPLTILPIKVGVRNRVALRGYEGLCLQHDISLKRR